MLSVKHKTLFIKLFTRKGRKKTPFFVSEGITSAMEILNKAPEAVECILLSTSLSRDFSFVNKINSTKCRVYNLSDEEFKSFAETETPQGIILLVHKPEYISENEKIHSPYVMILDGVSDPGNMGTIIRSAWASGLDEIWITKGTTDPFGRKAVRAGMGGQFNIKFRMLDDISMISSIETLKDRDVWVTNPARGLSCFDNKFSIKNSIIILGNEAHGTTFTGDFKYVKIPMPGSAESLNVAQCATIIMFETVRRKLF